MSFQQKRLVAAARQAINAGKLGEARQLCERAVKKDRRDVDPLELLGVLALDRACWTRPRVTSGRVRRSGRASRATAFGSARRCGAGPPARGDRRLRRGRVRAARDPAKPRRSSVSEAGRRDGPFAVRPRPARCPGSPGALRGCSRTPASTTRRSRAALAAGRRRAASARSADAAVRPRPRRPSRRAVRRGLRRVPGGHEIDKPAFTRRPTSRWSTGSSRPSPARRSRPPAPRRARTCRWSRGMPRSGTTLVEQILDAHPQAAERVSSPPAASRRGPADGARLVRGVPGVPRGPRGRRRDGSAARLRRAAGASRSAKRVVDETLDNFELLGLISLIARRRARSPAGASDGSASRPSSTSSAVALPVGDGPALVRAGLRQTRAAHDAWRATCSTCRCTRSCTGSWSPSRARHPRDRRGRQAALGRSVPAPHATGRAR